MRYFVGITRLPVHKSNYDEDEEFWREIEKVDLRMLASCKLVLVTNVCLA